MSGKKGGEEEKQEEVALLRPNSKHRQHVMKSKNDGPYLQSWQEQELYANEKQFET